MKMFETFEKTTMVGLDLIEYYEKLRGKTDALQTLDISQYCYQQVYSEGEFDRENLNKMIGNVKEVITRTNDVETISFFQQEKSAVGTICPLSDNEAWFTYAGTGEFTLLRRDGQYIKSVKNEASNLSFVLHESGFLVCNSRKKNILKIDMSGKSSVWMDTSPLEAVYIGEALNGNVLISLCDEFSGTRTEQSQRSVRMVTPSGDVLQSYAYGEDGISPVLICPQYVTQNYNSDVCVVNRYEIAKGNWRGNVCVFYEDGGFRFVYSGHGGEFNPFGMCCDSLCNIICVNEMDNTIHVVSSEGSFLKYLLSRDTCVPQPVPLALHRGVLWVGSKGGEVRVYRYTH